MADSALQRRIRSSRLRLVLDRYEQAKEEFLQIQMETIRELRAMVPLSDGESDFKMEEYDGSISHDSTGSGSSSSLSSTSNDSVSSCSVLSSILRELRY